MKNTPTMHRRLLPLGLALGLIGPALADFNPVPLTPGSYTFDIVVESNTPPAFPYLLTVTAGSGSGLGDNSYYEQGLYARAGQTGGNSGIPPHNTTFTSINNANQHFLMPPDYTTNNELIIDSQFTFGDLVFNTPTTATNLAILGTGGGGTVTVNYTVTHSDTTTETGTFTLLDWFTGGGTVAWGANGRVDKNGNYNNFNSSSVNNNPPYLYSTTITITNASSPITDVSFSYFSGQHANFYAISGNASGAAWNPIPLSGFNQIGTMPAAFPLTATMDQGTNTVNNGNLATWFEQGFVRTNSTFGLPPSGSTFNSSSQPTHHYQMGNYSANNAILIDAAHTNANITPASPAPYTAFALLTAGGNIGGGNKMTNLCIMQHADGVNETNTFYGYDWFEGSVPGFVAFTSNGRVNMYSRTVNNLGNGNPKLFETYFPLADTTSPVTNMILRYVHANSANATTFIMGVSATAGGVPPVVLNNPQWLNAYAGQTAQFKVTLGSGTAPVYTWQKGASANGPFSNLTDGGNVSGSSTTTLSLANIASGDAAYYQVVITNAVGAATSTPVALYLLTSTQTNITRVADSISDSSFINNPGSNPGEGVTSAIDHTTSKYLCFGQAGTGAAPYQGPGGFILTPGVGPTVVSALRIYTANDSPERDPADIMLEGSNDGGSTWTTLVPDTALALPDARNGGGQPISFTNQVLQEVDFVNTATYTSYRVTINDVKTNTIANSLAFGEIEFLGYASGPPVVVVPYTLPETNVVVLGGTAVMSVAVGGTTPITYQWTHAGTNLSDNAHVSGSHSNTLVISNVQLPDDGFYRLNITNAAGFYNVYPGGGADQTLIAVAVPTFEGNGAGWTTSGNTTPATIANNVLTLTTGAGSTAKSAFFSTPMPITAFEASWIYTDVGVGGADGFSFCVQNDPRGATALGGAGGALGVSGITPSAEFTFNIFGGAGISFGTNGNNGNPYTPTAPFDFSNGNPIAMKLVYVNGSAALTMSNTVTFSTFATNYPVANIPLVVSNSTAYVGFTGADGGISSTQTISGFLYVPLTTLSAQVSGSSLVLTWPITPQGYVLQTSPGLTPPSWSNSGATVTQVSGNNQVTVPLASGAFYRLAIPLPQ
jgi:hypothetical protein